jgi:hypothetical protein
MRQQVNAIVELVFDADATLNALDLAEAIAVDVGRLLDADSESPVALVGLQVLSLKEEGEIYGNA